MSEKTKDNRARNFATVVYPESANENWQSILYDLCVPCMVSPLHDLDTNPDGEIKKSHYHVMFMFDGKKSLEQVRELCESFGGVGCERIESKRGYARYLCHLDNPEKHQYDTQDVICYGGADYHFEIGTVLDKYKAIRDIIAFCKENDILAYSDLLEYCADEKPDWFRVVCDNTICITGYLKSVVWKKENHIK